MLEELPVDGSVSTLPWVGNRWRMANDGVAWRWQGEGIQSPAEKYAEAFDHDPSYIVNWERTHHGTAERDPEPWWGHCNGWAAAALLIQEPQHAVQLNGVQFEVGDIKALVIEVFFGTSGKMLGYRCYGDDLELDDRGVPLNNRCADTNAGAFHVVVANLLGLQSEGLVFDMASGSEVLNHVATGYRTDITTITSAEAAETVGCPSDEYCLNPRARHFQLVSTELEYLPEDSVEPSLEPVGGSYGYLRTAYYSYVLELDIDRRIIGGAWVGDSRVDHPDFLWVPRNSWEEIADWATRSVSNSYINYNEVMQLHALSVE